MVLTIIILGVLQIILLPVYSSTPAISNTTREINGFHYIGKMPSNKNVIFTIYIPLKNTNEIFYYAQAVSNPSSPLYHKFLTKNQLQQFLPAQKYEQVLQYLKENNLKIISTALDSVIVAEGSVSQIQQALGINIQLYSNGSTSYYISEGTPKISGITVIAQNLTQIYLSHPNTLITQKEIKNLDKKLGQINATSPKEAYWGTALQKVYNATSLYKIGDEGQGYNIGILDFYGDPYIFQQLAYYDKITGLPNTNFTVVPIGPYDPELGILTGWAGEISLDVEISHTMAPKANITLYIANGALPLSSDIACIDQLDQVDVLSQSFSIPESLISQFSGELFYSCIYESDVYYALGSAEGITFLASSGDAGGAGYSNGPVGTPGYPATSPFVTSLGGTTTYIQFPGNSSQTAWSNYGFVPDDINYGGSTGGISIIEPKPWYQWSLATPNTYPSGKEVPQISANANVYPGIYIICPDNITCITGGTSEASPLTAGLLTLVMNYVHSRLGLINPILDEFGENSTIYPKVFNPITFGYNIPWTASYGYNLVTGWGTLNIGNFAYYYNQIISQKTLSIEVTVLNSTGETPIQTYPDETIEILANITYNGTEVTSGVFNTVISSIEGNISTARLVYNPALKQWTVNITLPSNANGILDVNVYGKYNGTSGYGFDEMFSGYFAEFISPQTFVPAFNSNIVLCATNSSGELANYRNISVTIYYYNISTNTYSPVTTINATFSPLIGAWYVQMPQLQPGDYLIIANNVFGYVAFTYGVELQSLFILPQVISEPGVVYGGQSIIIEGLPVPPPSLSGIMSEATGDSLTTNLMEGSNLTAELVNQQGVVVSSAQIFYSSSLGEYFGYLPVPTNATPGLYTIMLYSSYNSITLSQYINGSFYGQIYVGKPNIVSIKPISYAYEGETLQIYANITYQNGTEVKYGMFSATVYPRSLSSEYTDISIEVELPLWYNAKLGLWYGNITLPSTYSAGNLTYLEGLEYYGAPFEILITGESSNGYVTSTSLSNEFTFYILPYTEIEGQTITDPQTYDVALINDKIIFNGTLANDILINDTIEGNVIITNSNVTNVTFTNSQVTIISSKAYDIKAINSNISLIDTTNYGISLENSQITTQDSVVTNISPSPAKIELISPTTSQTNNLTGIIKIEFNVIGQDIKEVELMLNGEVIKTYTINGTLTYMLNTSVYPDGTYKLQIVAIQNDNIVSNISTSLTFQNSIIKLNSNEKNLSSTISTLNSSISSSLSSINHSISSENSKISSVSTINYVSLAIAIIAIIIAIVALIRRK
ncbi:protease pro-enzyme activation domain-containing protein [Acidianus manzaensis]|uniref:protease pro-enzyme activation domain-containing protein n=1 Tax=Acidianus manzaensis TaxID=282676 RepID=UPI0011E5D91C